MSATQRRLRIVLVAAVAVLGLSFRPASAAPTLADGGCPSAEAIPVALLATLSPLCDVTGQLVIGDGVGVRVPPAGQAATMHALGTDGEIVLEVRHEPDGRVSGVLTTFDGGAPAEGAGVITESMVGGQPACADSASAQAGAKQSHGLLWSYDGATDPSWGTAAAYHEEGVTSAIVNLLDGYNDCGLAGGFRASQTYLGQTTSRSSIGADSTCGGLDGASVVDWGSVSDPNFLALTCRYDVLVDLPGDEEVLEADIRIANAHSYLAGPPASTCADSYDLMGVMTHEWGHAFGLEHTPGAVADHRQQTMVPVMTPCSTFQRTLGLGDWTGMNAIYGHG